MGILYFIIALCACTVGAVTGMGGGVFIKPILDMLGQYDVGTINMLSSITVFCMSIVSVIRSRKTRDRPSVKTAVSLAVGSVVGGSIGGKLISLLIAGTAASRVTLVQNLVLLLLVVCVLIYMKNKVKIPSLQWDGIAPGALVGLFLGVCLSFLGIGGGPINVSLIIFCFGYSTKQAALCSLITILFSQISKLAPALITGRMAQYDLSVLPFMAVGAIAGGMIGSAISRRNSAERADRLFQYAQILVLLICAINIVRSTGMI